MNHELSQNDPRNLWQRQPSDSTRMSIDEIRVKTDAFQKRIHRRNLREYIATATVLVSFSVYAILLPGFLIRLGSAMCVPAGVFVAWYLHRSGSARTLPADLALASGVEFHRKELERQRDLLRRVWLWNLAPFVPGLAVMIAGFGLPRRGLVISVVLIAGLWSLMWWVNVRASRKLQREIDALTSMQE